MSQPPDTQHIPFTYEEWKTRVIGAMDLLFELLDIQHGYIQKTRTKLPQMQVFVRKILDENEELRQ